MKLSRFASLCCLIALLVASVGASSQSVTRSFENIGLKMTYPAGWRVEVAESTDASRPVDPAAVRFTRLDDQSSVLAVLRRQEPLKAGVDAGAHVRSVIAEQKQRSIKAGGKIIAEGELTVAKAPARSIEMETTAQRPTRILLIVFVAKGHEYKIAMAGLADAVDRVRPEVMKAIESLEGIDPA